MRAPQFAKLLPLGKAADRPRDYCGPCYNAYENSTRCCNTCDDVRDAYISKGWTLDVAKIEQCVREGYTQLVEEERNGSEGCEMRGSFKVHKVAGNFHFAPGKSFQQFGNHVHDVAGADVSKLDFAHRIKELRFGDAFAGQANPLTNVVRDANARIFLLSGGW